MKIKKNNDHFSEFTKLQYRYISAFEKRANNLLDEISSSEIIKSHFEFLGDFYEKNKLEKNYHLFPLPAFKAEGKDFQEVVEDLAGPLFTKDLLKRIESITHKYGVNFLNNFYFLSQLYGIQKLDIDLILDMNHSQAIDRGVIDQLDPLTFKFLFEGMDQKRAIDLILSAKEMMVYDIFKLIDENPKAEELKSLVPKDAKTFEEIHDAFQMYVSQLQNTNRALNQEIRYFNGKKILEFEIEVPASSHDLYYSSKLVDEIFTHNIDRLASHVISGEIQILNLTLNGKKAYTVELIPTPEGLRVNRIKGIGNENYHQRDLSKDLHDNLKKVIR